MDIQSFNRLSTEEAAKLLFSCCGSESWVKKLMQSFPFSSVQSLVSVAENAWYNVCSEKDWRESFTQHPKIGDIKSLSEKFASTKHLAGNEQSGVETASPQLIEELARANTEYEQKFGFIFIVCATGKSAAEMLRLLLDRISNTVTDEVQIAMGEQHKITIIRFKKLLQEADWSFLKVSQLTTHVLDTSIGKPGEGITIRLQQSKNENWQTVSQGVTNADGRIADLLPPCRILAPGNYKLVFETASYFLKNDRKGFYPQVDIQFSIFDDTHYHVPLLINPFGYSTYRGS